MYVTESVCCTAEIDTSLEVYFKEKKKNLYSFLKSLNPPTPPAYTHQSVSSVAQSCLTVCNPMNRSTPTHNSPTPLYTRTSPFTYTFSFSLSLTYIHNYSVGFSMKWLLPCKLYLFGFLPYFVLLGFDHHY